MATQAYCSACKELLQALAAAELGLEPLPAHTDIGRTHALPRQLRNQAAQPMDRVLDGAA